MSKHILHTMLLLLSGLQLTAQCYNEDLVVIHEMDGEQLITELIQDDNALVFFNDLNEPAATTRLAGLIPLLEYYKAEYDIEAHVIDKTIDSAYVDIKAAYDRLGLGLDVHVTTTPTEVFNSTDRICVSKAGKWRFSIWNKVGDVSYVVNNNLVPKTDYLLMGDDWQQTTGYAYEGYGNFKTINRDSTIDVFGDEFFYAGGLHLRDEPTGIVWRTDLQRIKVPYLMYNLDICDEMNVMDKDFDKLLVKIEDRYVKNGLIHLETDRSVLMLDGTWQPWVWIEGWGSNAGLLFDIVGEHVASTLVCHESSEHPYMSKWSDGYCGLTPISESQTEIKRIYPNPSRDVFKWEGEYVYVVYDQLGRQVRAGRGSSVDLSAQAVGLYYLILEAKDGTVDRHRIIRM